MESMEVTSNMQRALVTGATGLLGSHLVKELLKRNVEVVALVQDTDPRSVFALESLEKKASIVNGCLENSSDMERAIGIEGVDTVFHLGAQALVEEGVRSPMLTFESNVRGTYVLLDTCHRHSKTVKRIICASSDKAYGSSPNLPYTEDMPLRGEHPYDVSKSCMDLICQSYVHTYELPLCILRCGNIYGSGDVHWSRLIPGTIRSVLRGQQPEIRSDGTFTRDYLFVEDVVEGYLKVADEMGRDEVRGQAFNLGPNEPTSVIDVVRTILPLMNANGLGERILNRASKEIRNQYLSSEKAEKLLKWTPRHSLKEGLKKTIPWYEELLKEEFLDSNIRNREKCAASAF